MKPNVIPANVEDGVLLFPFLVPLGVPLGVVALWMYLSEPVLANTAQPASSSSSKGKKRLAFKQSPPIFASNVVDAWTAGV